MASQNNKETSIMLKNPHDNIRRGPHSLKWRIFHGTHTMLGGFFLIAGSYMCFTEIIKQYPMAQTAGGWFFTIGSFFLLLADLQEWWYQRNNFGFVKKYHGAYALSNNNNSQQSPSSALDQRKRNEIEINYFGAACGSALYVVGSFLLIPTFEKYMILGDWLIIAGSAIIFLSASWKICRASHINVVDPHDRRFRLENILYDISAIAVDVFAGLGGAFFLFGVMLALPSFSKDDFDVNRSATLCLIGGTCFFLASIVLQFRYYCRYN